MERNCQIVEIMQRMIVTADKFPLVKGIVPVEQHAEIRTGDIITLILFYNGPKSHYGIVTVWHNRSRAAIKTPDINLFGEWDEARGILVTDETEQAWTIHGEEISGRIAFDFLGFDGILCSGEFFRPNPPSAGRYRRLIDSRLQ
jgi:hypothetical protein